MKKYIFSISALLSLGTLSAQVRTVNSATNVSVTNSPAFIDASSNTTVNGSSNIGKGLIFPRVDLSAMTAFPSVTAGIPNSFPTRFDGMIVYNTAASGTAGVGSTQGTLSPGYWYYENKSSSNTGGTWKPVSTATAAVANTASNGLTLSGNDVKLGGTLSQATTISNNGNQITFAGSSTGTTFSPVGNVGIGTSTPSATLDIVGTLKASGKATLANDLDVAGTSSLNSMSSNTIILNGATGAVRKAYFDALGRLTPGITYTGTDITSADNGLTAISNNVVLGGNLTQDTSIINNGKSITFAGSNTGATFSSTGNVGIGTTAPASPLDVKGEIRSDYQVNTTTTGTTDALVSANSTGSGYSYVRSRTTGSGFPFFDLYIGNVQKGSLGFFNNNVVLTSATGTQINTSNGPVAIVPSTGKVGINRYDPAETLDVTGTFRVSSHSTIGGNLGVAGILYTGDIVSSGTTSLATLTSNNLTLNSAAGGGTRYAYFDGLGRLIAGVAYPSDARLKTNVEMISNGLSKVMALRPVSYDWKKDAQMNDHKQLGFIAQEIKKVVPEVVYVEERNGYKDLNTVNYEQLTALLTKAIQEQQAQIEQLKSENKEVKTENKELKSEVEAIKKKLGM